MGTIVFASPKGGSGKSSSAVVLAGQLSAAGGAVTIIDADPNQPIAYWSELPGKPDNLTVLADVNERTILDQIEDASRKTPFVIVDVEGTASVTLAYAISRADLVIIPVQGSQLDAREAVKAINLIRQQEEGFGRPIPFAALLTRTSAAIQPRTLRFIRAELEAAGVPVFETQMHEREAFRAIFSFGGTVETLSPDQVSGLEGAVKNARAFAEEVVAILTQQVEGAAA